MNRSHSTVIALSAIDHALRRGGVVLSGHACWSFSVQKLFSPIPNWSLKIAYSNIVTKVYWNQDFFTIVSKSKYDKLIMNKQAKQ